MPVGIKSLVFYKQNVPTQFNSGWWEWFLCWLWGAPVWGSVGPSPGQSSGPSLQLGQVRVVFRLQEYISPDQEALQPSLCCQNIRLSPTVWPTVSSTAALSSSSRPSSGPSEAEQRTTTLGVLPGLGRNFLSFYLYQQGDNPLIEIEIENCWTAGFGH